MMKKLLWLTACALAFGISVGLAGYVGFSKSMRVMTAPAPRALVASVVPLPPPVHDPHKPTVAVLLGNTLSEPTDVLGPYAMFAESGAYNVYTVADSRTVRTLTGGLDVVPHLSFDELAARVHGDPDIVVVPQIADIRAAVNASVVAWVRRQGRGHALLFSWCTGAEVLAESGVLDGKAATAHWGDIDRLERVYPRVHWQRGVRYVDGGTLLSTAGLTAGVDATLHLLARRHGAQSAEKVAQALHIPPSPFVENPKCEQFKIGLGDAIFLLNASFRWPKPRLNVSLYDGVDELGIGSLVDVYGVSAAYQIRTRSAAASVLSRHGIQLVPRERGVVVRSEGTRQFAYIAAIEDLARQQDAWTARFAAKRLEIRTPLRIEGGKPLGKDFMEYLIGVGIAAAVCAFAMVSGFDRERVFYPTVLIVVGHYYILFAAMGSSGRVLALECLPAAAFLALAIIGFKKSLWVTAAALAGHGVFDLFHHLLIQNPGVPGWWPGFCMSFDVLAGGFLAVLLMRGALDVSAGGDGHASPAARPAAIQTRRARG